MSQVPTTNDVTHRGLGLPAFQAPGGYFARKTGIEKAWSDLVLAVFTPQGGRPMRRTFGTAIYDTLFDPNDAKTSRIVEEAVRGAAERLLPHVQIRGVDVEQDGKRALLRIQFSLIEDSGIEERTILVDQQGPVSVSPA